MKVGDLVRVPKPAGRIGLIIRMLPITKTGIEVLDDMASTHAFEEIHKPYALWDVLVQGEQETRRYHGFKLEVVKNA